MKKYFYFVLYNILSILLYIHHCHAMEPQEPYLDYKTRPLEIKQAISTSFDGLQNLPIKEKGNWKFNGHNRYGLCLVHEHKLFKEIIQNDLEQTEFYVLDIGSGRFEGGWGRNFGEFINLQQEIRQNITVHIISLTAENNDKADVCIDGICKYYEYGRFRIEELTSELEKRGLFLQNKIDLIVSRWCFRHLVDPVGTFVQTFNLLRPQTGLLFMDGFFFQTQKDVSLDKMSFWMNYAMANLLLDTNAPFLIHPYLEERSLNQFLLRRPNEVLCQLPLTYKSFISGLPNENAHSGCITIFTDQAQDTRHISIDSTQRCNECQTFELKCYCRNGNRIANFLGDQSLFHWLKEKDLFGEDPYNGFSYERNWKPIPILEK